MKWKIRKLAVPSLSWIVISPEGIKNRFSTWSVAFRFASLLAYGRSVMRHPFRFNPRDGRCLICEEVEECHLSDEQFSQSDRSLR